MYTSGKRGSSVEVCVNEVHARNVDYALHAVEQPQLLISPDLLSTSDMHV